ncbi:hypothetical protein SAMN06265349_104331 [Flavobacterium resistens]|uniref:Uncharacterized protein n=1 Tax=Flavobacterium resistens TaxID=443612 RepID=A0A521ECS4_9FLAO|nr:hypothetical protein [Flavobacterium resistens]MRX68991.1 hypothetical protein [Flavobacterium resistens]SMO81261.1 hypothetical protein SAMN06265349_104331 [Flavobacterium resistens]
MEFKKSKLLIIIFSILLFSVSLTQNAVTINYSNEIKVSSSIDYFLMGSTAFLGGGLLEQIIWMANPLSFFAIIYFIKDNSKKAVVLSFIASCLSVSFSFWKEILGAESGSMAQIVSLELGYYFWVSSILVLTIGIFIYYKESLKEIWES